VGQARKGKTPEGSKLVSFVTVGERGAIHIIRLTKLSVALLMCPLPAGLAIIAQGARNPVVGQAKKGKTPEGSKPVSFALLMSPLPY
jgi:hypothetical protein